VYVSLAIVAWLAFLASGVHPTLAGVAIALLIPVYRPNRTDVEHALELARTFRQSPNTPYARAAANSLRESISINDRLQSAYAPYVAYVGQTLARPVDPARDHVLGDPDAPYTIVEYGDFRCGFCLKASGSILEVRNELGDRLRYVWRHAPLEQIHPNALAGAEASEAAAAQGRFFDFARAIFDDQDNQRPSDIIRIAHDLGLDVEQFEKDLISAEVTGRVADDILDAEAMNITAVPTLFINGRRHVGPYDAQSLLRALTAPND
jgi:protein-disulfide isomerase